MLPHFELDVPIQLAAMPGTRLRLHDRGSDVMDHVIAFGGNNLDCLNVAVFAETRIDQNIRPPVRPVGLHHHIFRQADDHIRLADLPCLVIREFARRRHISRTSLRSAAIHPLDDRRDFIVGQRLVIIEMLNSYIPIDEPRRHFPGGDSLLDGPRPRPRLFVAHERHRRNRACVMAILAMLLKNRRHILGERGLLRRVSRRGRYGESAKCD